MPIRIAVDAMGGDHAPSAVVDGAIEAARQSQGAINVLLVGPENRLREELSKREAADPSIQVVDAAEVIGMDESPASAVKSKTRSSIHVGLEMHKQDRADAFVSAGNTGAVMAAALFVLGRIPNVHRPTIGGFFPTTDGETFVLDVGANVDCKPEHLLQFARMGTIYAQRVMQRSDPSVGLLNVGEEPGKGDEVSKAAYALLNQTAGLTFKGNVEGRDIMHHAADVVVCDGFVGNVLLKFGESVPTVFVQMIASEMKSLGLTSDEQQVVRRTVGSIKRKFDYEEFGGTPLLGVAGNVVIGHGSSTPRAITKMITKAAEVVRHDLAGAIRSAFA